MRIEIDEISDKYEELTALIFRKYLLKVCESITFLLSSQYYSIGSNIPDEVASEILNLSEEETQEYFRFIRDQYEEFEEELKRRLKCWRSR